MSSRGGLVGFLALFLLVLVPVGLAACGSEDSSDSQSLAYTSTSEDNGVKLNGPTTAASGLTEISLKNDTKADSDFQLVGVEDDHSVEETIKGVSSAIQGGPLPDWISLEGGVGATPAGETATVTQVLQPGIYYAFDTNGKPTPDLAATLEVTGEDSDETLEADATVDAFDYDFKTDGLKVGENEVLLENTGAEAHHLVYAPIIGDATAADIEKSLKEEKGPPPLDEKESKTTAVLNGGQDQLVKLDFDKPGRYALLCFVSDREGGPPHALQGMVAEVDVK